MKSFLKIFIIVLLALVVAQALPLVGLPAGIGLGALAAAGVFLFLCVGGLLAGALGILGVVLAVVLVILAVLSPIWLPILLIVGIVSLCRRGRRNAQTVEVMPPSSPTAA